MFHVMKVVLDRKLVHILLMTLPKFVSASIYSRIPTRTQQNLHFRTHMFCFNMRNDSLTAEASYLNLQVRYCTPTRLKPQQ